MENARKNGNRAELKKRFTSESTRKLTQFALLVSIIVLMTFTPIGYIRTNIIEITLIHIPVIVAAILFGVKGGALMGFFFGLSSLTQAFISPTPLAVVMLGTNTGFGLYNLVLIITILFIPRILVGVFTALVYKAIAKKGRHGLGAAIGALTGSLTNTVLFLGLLFLLARELVADALGIAAADVATVLFTLTGGVNGSLEAIAAVAVAVPVCKAVQVSRHNREYDRTHKAVVKKQVDDIENTDKE